MAIVAVLYDWLLFLHIVAAMVWVGGLVALNVLVAIVLRGGGTDEVARFVSALRVVGPATLAPAMLGVLAFGIWLVLDSDTWSFGQTWVWLALVLFGVAFLVGAVFQSRSALAAQHAVESGDGAEAARQLRRWAWGMRVILVVLLAVVWDMVFKPWL
ncbi:MAG TPA: DUF2269 family protein [Gaiella sp.]|jgi:uncharacterized membrane protein